MKLDFERINYFRRQNGLSVIGLCKLIGISRTTLWKWGNGKLPPSEKLVQKMAKVLNVSLSEISDIKEPVPISQKNLSDVVDSWLTLADLNTRGHQEEIGNILDSIKNLNNKLNQAVVIIKALLDTMETMFYIKDSRLKYLTANVSFLNNVSFNPEDRVLGKDDFVFFSQDEARENTEEDRVVLQSGQPILRQERLLPGCRKTKWGIVSKIPVFDSDNKIVGIVGTFIDITERKKSEGNFKFIEQCLNSTSQIIIIADGIKNQFVYISKRSFEAISGYSVNDIYKAGNAETTLRQICHPEDFYKFSIVVNWPETHTFEWRMICSDKKIKWIRMTVSLIEDESSNGMHFIWICIDITEEKEKELRKIKFSTFLQNELLEFAPQVLWTANINRITKPQFYELSKIKEKITKAEKILIKKNQYITIVDQKKYIHLTKESFEKISCYSINQLCRLNRQETLNTFCHPDDIPKHIINIKWPDTQTYEWRMVTAENEIRWIRTTKTHITDTSNKFLYSISTSIDITDIKNNKLNKIPQKQIMQNKTLKSLIYLLWPYAKLQKNLSFIYLSDEIQAITGYPKADFTEEKRPIQSIIHPDYLDKFYNLQETKPTSGFEFKVITSQDKIVDMKTSVLSKETEDGETLYYGKAELV